MAIQPISREELSRLLKRREVVLVDVLSPEQFRKSHLPGAINIPADQVVQVAPRLLPDRRARIVVYCLNFTGRVSDQAARELTNLGYEDVSNYEEGKQDWMLAGLPLDGEAPHEPVTGFRPSATEDEARQRLRQAS